VATGFEIHPGKRGMGSLPIGWIRASPDASRVALQDQVREIEYALIPMYAYDVH
jgi:hypothetical protein